MASTCDVAVVGLGAMGSATVYELAGRGARVIGVDRLSPPHTTGSSHGETRITRLAVGEGDAYVGFVRRSHERWRELEASASAPTSPLYVASGGLILGAPGSTGHHGVDRFVTATIDIARRHAIEHEVLSAREVRERFGVFAVGDDDVGYYEPTAGYLRAEDCVRTHLAEAARLGAELRRDERVVRIEPVGAGVRIETDRSTVHAGSVVVAAGPWLAELLPELAHLVSVQRQVQYWFDVVEHAAAYEALPIFIWFHGAGVGEFAYGFPAVDGTAGGVKVATEVDGEATTPELVERTVAAGEVAAMHAAHVEGRLLGLSARCVRSAVCLYTVTADAGFLLDVHPEHQSVVVASPCSGHGFKHSPAVGECAAALALAEPSPLDVAPFRIDRLG